MVCRGGLAKAGRRGLVCGAVGGRSGWQGPIQVAVPDSWHAGVDLADFAEEGLRPRLVTCGVRGPGFQDQPPGSDLLCVLLPVPSTCGVEGGGLFDQLPGLVQVSGLVCLVGGYRGAVDLHPAAVARGLSCPVGTLALRGDVPIITGMRGARFRFGLLASRLVTAAGAAGITVRRPGMTLFLLGHAVQGFIDVANACAGGGEFGDVLEGLADAAAGVVHLAAGVFDVARRPGRGRRQPAPQPPAVPRFRTTPRPPTLRPPVPGTAGRTLPSPQPTRGSARHAEATRAVPEAPAGPRSCGCPKGQVILRRGQTADAYLHACIRWLARDPDAALAATADDWPAPRPAGRPPSRERHSPARPASSGPPPADGS